VGVTNVKKKLIVFDLDGTLAPSKSAMDQEMSVLLGALLWVAQVSIISGGAWTQFESQVLPGLPSGSRLSALSLLPTCGTRFYRYDTEWRLLYSEDLTDAEAGQIAVALREAAASVGPAPVRTWGGVIENRGTQVTFSGLGQGAPLVEKEKWDADFHKRRKMQEILSKSIPGFSVRLGGTTSIDVTKPGLDKGYGIRKLQSTLGIELDEMLFVGDALFPGGNDYPAQQAGVTSICVSGPEESKRVIETVIACSS
jgi:hypothetical protein